MCPPDRSQEDAAAAAAAPAAAAATPAAANVGVEPACCSQPDWAALPADLLRCVFCRVLPPNSQPGPLLRVARAWLALRLTCRPWAEVLAGAHVAVEACIPLPPLLPWLHRHATALRLVPPPIELSGARSGGAAAALGWVQDHCGPLSTADDWAGDLRAPQVRSASCSAAPQARARSRCARAARLPPTPLPVLRHPCRAAPRPAANAVSAHQPPNPPAHASASCPPPTPSPPLAWRPRQAAARIAFELYLQALATSAGRPGPFTFQSSLFVPPGAEMRYDGTYPPQRMLQLQDLRRIRVRRLERVRGGGGAGNGLAARPAACPCCWAGLPEAGACVRAWRPAVGGGCTAGSTRRPTRRRPPALPSAGAGPHLRLRGPGIVRGAHF